MEKYGRNIIIEGVMSAFIFSNILLGRVFVVFLYTILLQSSLHFDVVRKLFKITTIGKLKSVLTTGDGRTGD